MSEQREPVAHQAALPAGYRTQAEPTMLPWSFARERLEQAKNYWLATASATGRPHAAPVWGAWIDDRLYFEGSPATRWGRNLVANPQLTVHLESGDQVVIVEGTVTDVDDVGVTLAERITGVFAAKYDGYQPQGRSFFVLTLRRAFGWRQFPADATRWQFDVP